MSVGSDIKAAFEEVGTAITIVRDPDDITGEYIRMVLNSQVTKPFIREFFVEAQFAYDTQAVAGDVIYLSDGRYLIVMNKTPEELGGVVYRHQCVLYKCNAIGKISRETTSRLAYQLTTAWSAIKEPCHALLTESLYGNELDTEQGIGDLIRQAHELYLPHSYGLAVNDRFDVSQQAFVSSVSADGETDAEKEISTGGAPVSATWTVTFDSSTEFTVAGSDGLGEVGSGVIGTAFTPAAYFTIPADFFDANWLAGETYLFSTTAEYYRVKAVDKRRFNNVDFAFLIDDTR